eukprot:Sspe_Gene.114766::Locus_100985_Transcript_1_1_Confidence_1.000_Length_672::g.114766::m.114766
MAALDALLSTRRDGHELASLRLVRDSLLQGPRSCTATRPENNWALQLVLRVASPSLVPLQVLKEAAGCTSKDTASQSGVDSASGGRATAKWEGTWQPCTVVHQDRDGMVSVRWDDGSVTRKLCHVSDLRPAGGRESKAESKARKKSVLRHSRVGEQGEALWGGAWTACTVVREDTAGMVDLRWEDGTVSPAYCHVGAVRFFADE